MLSDSFFLKDTTLYRVSNALKTDLLLLYVSDYLEETWK
jgi:hypothetical protein